MTQKKSIKYVHLPLNEEITAIGGHYQVTVENEICSNNLRIFYTIGYGVVETSCCGMGGCCFATVYGEIKSWKSAKNGDGYFVSHFESIYDKNLRSEISELILKTETVQQVNFM